MIRLPRRPLLFIGGLLLIVGLPVVARWSRRHAPPRCAVDGLRIEPLYQVRIVDQAGGSHRCCCVACARLWITRRKEPPSAIYVTDEAGGAEIDARSAHFVRSAVVTNPITGNRTHAFSKASDAAEHARVFAGWPLTGTERPLP
jgi:hypothetical protein